MDRTEKLERFRESAMAVAWLYGQSLQSAETAIGQIETLLRELDMMLEENE